MMKFADLRENLDKLYHEKFDEWPAHHFYVVDDEHMELFYQAVAMAVLGLRPRLTTKDIVELNGATYDPHDIY
jgi:hypothetical protein